METPPDLRSVQKNKWVFEGLAWKWARKITPGHWTLMCLVLQACVFVFAGWYMGNQSLKFLEQILLWYLEGQGICWVTNYENITHPPLFSLCVRALSFSLSLSALSSNPHPGLGGKTKRRNPNLRLNNWALWAKRRWTGVNQRCFCPSMLALM